MAYELPIWFGSDLTRAKAVAKDCDGMVVKSTAPGDGEEWGYWVDRKDAMVRSWEERIE